MKWIVQVAWFLSIILVSYLSLIPHIQIPYEFSGADKLGHFLAYLWLGILPFFGFARLRVAFAWHLTFFWICTFTSCLHRGIIDDSARCRT